MSGPEPSTRPELNCREGVSLRQCLTGNRTGAAAWGQGAWLLLLALQPFNQLGALRQLTTAVLLASLVTLAWGAVRDRRTLLPRPGLCISLGLVLTLWILAVSALGPYPADSLHALRQSFLVQVLLVAGALTFIRTVHEAWRPVLWSLAGFGVLSLLSLGEIAQHWWLHGWTLDLPRSHDHWWGGYGAVGACMVPLLVGGLLHPGLGHPLRLAGLGFAMLAMGLVLLYGSRTPALVMLMGSAGVLLLARRWRLLLLATVMSISALVLLSTVPGERFTRYQSLLEGRTYVSNQGLSLRPALWRGVAEVISARPMVGYGYGWKKLAWAINDGGYAARWHSAGGDMATYFLAGRPQASYGRVNPHNYFLQVAFEIGIPGLLLALAFWATLIVGGLRLLTQTPSVGQRGLAFPVIGLVAAYWLSSMTNGYWQGGLANLALALAASLFALDRRLRSGSAAAVK